MMKAISGDKLPDKSQGPLTGEASFVAPFLRGCRPCRCRRVAPQRQQLGVAYLTSLYRFRLSCRHAEGPGLQREPGGGLVEGRQAGGRQAACCSRLPGCEGTRAVVPLQQAAECRAYACHIFTPSRPQVFKF